MSVESAKACIERVKTDEDFEKAVIQLTTKEERMDFVRSVGYDFTHEEFQEAIGELTDDELESVAAGFRPRIHTDGIVTVQCKKHGA